MNGARGWILALAVCLTAGCASGGYEVVGFVYDRSPNATSEGVGGAEVWLCATNGAQVEKLTLTERDGYFATSVSEDDYGKLDRHIGVGKQGYHPMHWRLESWTPDAEGVLNLQLELSRDPEFSGSPDAPVSGERVDWER